MVKLVEVVEDNPMNYAKSRKDTIIINIIDNIIRKRVTDELRLFLKELHKNRICFFKIPEKLIKNIDELSWFTGLVLADGYLRYHQRHHEIVIKCKDCEIIEHLKRLCEENGINYYLRSKDSQQEITISNVFLYYLILSGYWKRIRLNDNHFLQGFFDGDGLGLFPSYKNANKTILELIRRKLKKLKINHSKPIVTTPKGHKAYYKKEKRYIVTRADVYEVFIHPKDYANFLERIGTTVRRKQRLMELSIKVVERYQDRIWKVGDWWQICLKLRQAIGKNINCRKKLRPPP